ncbi:MAG: maleylpyruvate isomerase N-terminal domain-containing protein [Thermoanaerobaculia bacterium]
MTQQVDAFISCVRTADVETLQVYPLWTAKDVLCHLTFWHESFARNLSAVAHHQKPSPLKGTLAALNRQGVDELRPNSVDQLVGRLLAAHSCIRAAILDTTIGLIPYRRGSRPYTPDEHLDVVRAHIQKHTAEIHSALIRSTSASAHSHPSSR